MATTAAVASTIMAAPCVRLVGGVSAAVVARFEGAPLRPPPKALVPTIVVVATRDRARGAVTVLPRYQDNSGTAPLRSAIRRCLCSSTDRADEVYAIEGASLEEASASFHLTVGEVRFDVDVLTGAMALDATGGSARRRAGEEEEALLWTTREPPERECFWVVRGAHDNDIARFLQAYFARKGQGGAGAILYDATEHGGGVWLCGSASYTPKADDDGGKKESGTARLFFSRLRHRARHRAPYMS